MKKRLTNRQLEYLKSLLFLIEKRGERRLSGITVADEILILTDIVNRGYTESNPMFTEDLASLYETEEDLINSWKDWYVMYKDKLKERI